MKTITVKKPVRLDDILYCVCKNGIVKAEISNITVMADGSAEVSLSGQLPDQFVFFTDETDAKKCFRHISETIS